jgi:hypothetical protein
LAGEREEAMVAIRWSAVRLKPDHVWAHIVLGGLFEARGEHAEAVKEYELAAALGQDAPSRWGSVNRTVSAFLGASRKEFDLAIAHGNVGRALAARGRANKAADTLGWLRRLGPDPSAANDQTN